MAKQPSSSNQRHTFQLEKYVERCNEKGEDPDQEYFDMYLEMRNKHVSKFDDPESRKNNMEYDLLTTDWILEKVRTNKFYAQNLYAAMCNREFQKNDVWPMLKDDRWSCSWRYAGGIIADMRQEGDYIDWYCSGIMNSPTDEEFQNMTKEQQEYYLQIKNNHVAESVVTDEIREDLLKLGWNVIDEE